MELIINVALVNLALAPRPHATHCVDCALYASATATHQADCALHAVCLPPSYSTSSAALENIMERGPSLSRGSLLFHDAMPFNRIYVVRSGALKSIIVSGAGREQITGFCLPGDVVGLDSIGSRCYRTSAVALESTTVCGIPYASLRLMAGSLPAMHNYLLDLMSAELLSHHHLLIIAGKRPAEERVALFLVALMGRYQHRRLSQDKIRLPMTRGDIGNHLGLALETVCRILTRFQQIGVLRIRGRELQVLDGTQLQRIAQPMG